MTGTGTPADERPDDGGGDGPTSEQAGLAAERTTLAWDRTSLALLACGAAVIRGVPAVEGVEARPGLGVTIVVLAVASWLLGLWNERRRRAAIAGGGGAAHASSLRQVAGSTALVAAVAFVIAAGG